MGSYISQTDIENIYGSDNVAAWSDLTGGDTADTTRIASSIAYAERYVDNKFRSSRYQVPFVATGSTLDPQLVDWAASFAGDWLYRSRQIRRRIDTEGLTSAVVERVREEMAEALAGQIRLGVAEKADPMPSAPGCVF